MGSSSISHQRWSSRIQWVWLSWTLISLAALFSRSSLITSARGWQLWFLLRVKGSGTFSYFHTIHLFPPVHLCLCLCLSWGCLSGLCWWAPNRLILFLFPSLLFFFSFSMLTFLFIFTSILMISQMRPGPSFCQKTLWTVWGLCFCPCDSSWYFVAVPPEIVSLSQIWLNPSSFRKVNDEFCL